jgi:CTD small phosphatase-like protein 2
MFVCASFQCVSQMLSFFDHIFLLLITAGVSLYAFQSKPLLISPIIIYIEDLLTSFFHHIFLSPTRKLLVQLIDEDNIGILSRSFRHSKAAHIQMLLQQTMLGCEFDIVDPSDELNFSSVSFPTLVLDLDETLLHSTQEIKSRDHDYTMWDEDHLQHSYVYKRPFVDSFVNIASRYFEIVVFTASYACYCDPLLSTIKHNEVISKRLYNTSMYLSGSAVTLEKDLYLTTPSNMPNRLIMVDNSPLSCPSHPENMYLIRSYFADDSAEKCDLSLVQLLLVLLSMVTMDDFRPLLGRRILLQSSGPPQNSSR